MWPAPLSRYSPIGVELTADGVRLAQLARTPQGWRLQAAAAARAGNGEARESAALIRALLASQPFKGRRVVAALADRLLDAVPLRLALEAGQDVEAALLKEVAGYLPYHLGEAVIDYCVFEDKRAEGGSLKTLVFAARREQVDAHLAVLEAARLRPVALDASPFALQRLVARQAAAAPRVLLVSLGSLDSTLAVLWDGLVFLQRVVPWGIESMAAAFVQGLGLRPELARKTLSRFDFSPGAAQGGQERAGQETIAQVGSAELARLVTEIERVLVYCASEMRGAVIDQIVLAGQCQAIRGLGGFLERTLGIAARLIEPFEGLEGRPEALPAALAGREAMLAVACGLAWRGEEP